MGIWDRLFAKEEGKNEGKAAAFPWVSLSDAGQLEEIDRLSEQRPQLLFKHSTTCGISRMVLSGFERARREASEGADYYLLDLHAQRALSQEIARRYGIVHESPQLLVVRNKVVTEHASHGGILDLDLAR